MEMGNAVCSVHNKTHKKLCVVTFNQADLMYSKYENMYSLDPGASCVVEALTNPIGLKVGIVFDAVPGEGSKAGKLEYMRWQVKKEKVLTITSAEKDAIATSGDGTAADGRGSVSARKAEDFSQAVDCLTFQKSAVRDAGMKLGGGRR